MYPDVLPGFLSKEAETNWLIELKETYWKQTRLTDPTGDWPGDWEVCKSAGSKEHAQSPFRFPIVWWGPSLLSPLPSVPVLCLPWEVEGEPSDKPGSCASLPKSSFPHQGYTQGKSLQDHNSRGCLKASSKCLFHREKERCVLGLLLTWKLCSWHRFYPIHRQQGITVYLYFDLDKK